jgi:hypothetical protein
MLLMHIIFGLAIYPVAVTCYFVQNKLSFHISSGLIQDILLIPIVYWGFRVGLVFLWIYFGLSLAGLDYDEALSNAYNQLSDQLMATYLFVWIVAVVMLAIKAHLKADQLLMKLKKD